MQSSTEDKNIQSSPDQLLNSLVRELKSPLILIARHAELEKAGSKDASAFASIQGVAEKTLQLIDSYLLMARAEYGQKTFPMETVGVGSVIHEVEEDLSAYARDHQIDFAADVKDGNVMANRDGLRAVVWCLVELVMAQNDDKEKGARKRVVIRTRREKQKVSISVLGNRISISNKDIDIARSQQGMSHLAGGKIADSGIRLAIADVLASSLGSNLQVKRINGLKGLSFDLALSSQLQLI
ncbi:MAG TPA: hypothetical protein VFK11_05010 [Candidatus Saccharimonadales bacterium]|nr:hypothetical protein [Candidatus Saccharimonadales bacterium]